MTAILVLFAVAATCTAIVVVLSWLCLRHARRRSVDWLTVRDRTMPPEGVGFDDGE